MTTSEIKNIGQESIDDMLALSKMPKQQKQKKECSMENKLQFSIRMEDI
jgi:hypothetical protein